MCVVQNGAGYLLVCSEHGVFAYDGRTFQNLGRAQGLKDGGVVRDVALTKDGRVAVRFVNQLFISASSGEPSRPPNQLSFRAVDLHGLSIYDNGVRQLAPFGAGFAVIVGRQTMKVVFPPSGDRATLARMGYTDAEQAIVVDPKALFSVRGVLWETFKDGRLCVADPGSVRCYKPTQPRSTGPWEDVIAGPAGTVMMRGHDRIAKLDPVSGAFSEEMLPDQGGPYDSNYSLVGLFHTPAGELLTQSADGLIVRKPTGWVHLTVGDGVPSGVISSVLDDRDGQLWIEVFGRGLYRGLDYGHWEGLQNDDGLSQGITWQVVRPPGGSLWVSTDSGLDEVLRSGGALGVGKTVPVPSYALAVGPEGDIWTSSGWSGARAINPASGLVRHVAVPLVNAIVGDERRVWLATENGLYRVDAPGADRPVALPDALSGTHVTAAISDGSGGVWLVSNEHLWHRRSDGSCIAVGGGWPSGGFEPYSMAMAPHNHLWIGGDGEGSGLYDLSLSGDRVMSISAVAQSNTRTNTVVAVAIDHRGWVWAGTGLGVSVYNGHRWVSVDASLGLVWNDVSENGIFEDADGSVWVATSEGLSHLLDPDRLFSDRPLRIVISDARMDGQPLSGQYLPYSTAPLSVQFGTLSYAFEKSVVFRYRMSGVDRTWVESSTGSVRYPSVPPGHHVLTVIGYDVLRHTSSAPVNLPVDMAFPWWRSWWADLLYILAFPTGLTLLVKLRERAATRTQRQKQHELERLVEERTRDMRIAQAELRRLATLDGLTGLLNRAEVQRRLVEKLAAGRTAGDMLVGMVDIDHFKRINDVHGHLVGDDVLRAVGVRIAAALRDGDCAGRYGGEEMLVVLDDADGRAADRILLLHQAVRGARFHVDDVGIAVTCSIGVAWAGPGDDWRSLVGRADAALYEAKAAGRDRVVESGEDQTLNPSAWPSVEALKGRGTP